MASSPPTLLSLNPDLMGKICEYLDFKVIMNLRKVCRDIRNFIEDTTPDIFIFGFSIHVKEDGIELAYPCWTTIRRIEYKKHGDGCAVYEEDEEKKILEKVDYLEAFYNDFKIMISHQKSFPWDLAIEIWNNEGIDQFYENLRKIFAANPFSIKIAEINLQILNQAHVMSILPYLDPMSLEMIELKNRSDDRLDVELKIDEVAELEQWKRAKMLRTDSLRLMAGLKPLMHFRRIRTCLESVRADELIELKEKFHAFSNYEYIDIRYKTFEDIQQFKEKLGQPLIGEDCEWHFSLNEGMVTLKIHMTPNCVHFHRVSAGKRR